MLQCEVSYIRYALHEYVPYALTEREDISAYTYAPSCLSLLFFSVR